MSVKDRYRSGLYYIGQNKIVLGKKSVLNIQSSSSMSFLFFKTPLQMGSSKVIYGLKVTACPGCFGILH